MALGALLNALSAVSSATSGITSAMSGIGSIVGGIGSALSSAFGKGMSFVMEKVADFKTYWAENITPIFAPLIERARDFATWFKSLVSEIIDFWVNLFTGDFQGMFDNIQNIWNTTYGKMFSYLGDLTSDAWDGFLSLGSNALSTLSTVWETYITPLWDSFSDLANNGLSIITGIWDNLVGKMTSIWNNNISPLWEKLTNLDPFGAISDSWDNFTNLIRTTYDNTIGPILDVIDGVISNIADILSSVGGTLLKLGGSALDSVINTAVKIIPGGSDGSAQSRTEGGTSDRISNNVYNINIDANGITDRTDKRSLAFEISKMMKEEISRTNSGTAGVSGRGNSV